MLPFRQAIVSIDSAHGRRTYPITPNRTNSFEELYIDFQHQSAPAADRYSIFLHPKQDLVLERLEVQFAVQAPSGSRFFANGYQSDSESRLLTPGQGIPRLHPLARPFLGPSGDETLNDIPRGKTVLHAWTYTYFAEKDSQEISFWGSLNESTGFTLFIYDQPNGILTVRKDLNRQHLSHSFPGLEFWTGRGRESDLFDRHLEFLRESGKLPTQASSPLPAALCWTSSGDPGMQEATLLERVQALSASEWPFRAVLLADGWQPALGDWRAENPRFPKGMGAVAAGIRAQGLQAGLWLAPFVAAANSALVRKNPDWLLPGAKGRPLRAGWNRRWGGSFFALNFYHPAVQDYLSGVFHVVFEKWGFDWVSLDGLYALSLAPPPHKNRGQVLAEGMEFLRRQAGKHRIVAGGVPLGAALGWADTLRAGGDTTSGWAPRMPAFLRYRERASLLATLRSLLGRWQWNERAFAQPPGVFSLFQGGQGWSQAQQQTVLSIQALLGGLLCTPDDPARYTPEQQSELQDALCWSGARVKAVQEPEPDLYALDVEQDGQHYRAWCNLSARSRFVPGTTKGRIEVRPFETLVLHRAINSN